VHSCAVELARSLEALADHDQHEHVEPQADPVAGGDEDDSVERVQADANREGPMLALEREIAKEHEAR